MSLLLYFLLACGITCAYSLYCRHRDYNERYKRAEAEILRDYEATFPQELTLTPIRPNNDLVHVKLHLLISVVPYFTRTDAYNAIIPLVEQALGIWAISLPKDEEICLEWYASIQQLLVSLSAPIAKLDRVAVRTIVPQKTNGTTTPISFMDEIKKASRDVQELSDFLIANPNLPTGMRTKIEVMKNQIMDPGGLQ